MLHFSNAPGTWVFNTLWPRPNGRHFADDTFKRIFWMEMLEFRLRPRQNGCHFADDNYECIFFNENVWISIKISLKFVPKGPINNMPALVLIFAWHRPGAKPLSVPMMVRSSTHICVTRPQWVNSTWRWLRLLRAFLVEDKHLHLTCIFH